MGATIDYQTVPLVFIPFPIVFLITFLMLPNTPKYHIQRGHTQVNYLDDCLFNVHWSWIDDFVNFQKAVKALKFYKGFQGKSKLEESALLKEFERLQLIASEREIETKIQASDFCKMLEQFNFQLEPHMQFIVSIPPNQS